MATNAAVSTNAIAFFFIKATGANSAVTATAGTIVDWSYCYCLDYNCWLELLLLLGL